MGFEAVKYDMERDKGENPLIWEPAHIQKNTSESA